MIYRSVLLPKLYLYDPQIILITSGTSQPLDFYPHSLPCLASNSDLSSDLAREIPCNMRNISGQLLPWRPSSLVNSPVSLLLHTLLVSLEYKQTNEKKHCYNPSKYQTNILLVYLSSQYFTSQKLGITAFRIHGSV